MCLRVFKVLVKVFVSRHLCLLPTEFYPSALHAGVRVLVGAPLTGRLVLLPVADSIGVIDYELVHPGKGQREQHCSLKEAQVASMLSQGKHHIGHLFCKCAWNSQ